MGGKPPQSIDETAVPRDIESVDDLRPYVRAAMAALKDRGNYQINYDGVTGCPDLGEIAAKALIGMGFGPYSAKWTAHPFHWVMYNQLGLVSHRTLDHPPKEKGKEMATGMFVLNNGSFDSVSIDELTERFMEGHGKCFLARIRLIREHPDHRPY